MDSPTALGAPADHVKDVPSTGEDFAEDEKVLVFHGPLLYEAKIVEAVMKAGNEKHYRIHYLGWKDRWDEVVEKTRVRKFTEESVQLKEYLLNHRSTLRRKERVEVKGPPEPGAVTSRDIKRRKTGEGLPPALDSTTTPTNGLPPTEEATAIVLHSSLKRQLIDDWEFVTKDKKLVPLPREPTVASILSTWLVGKSRRGVTDKASREVADGLRDYFDSALGTMLLYKFERPQYNQVVHGKGESVRPSSVYGAEHLLRLIVKLPALLEKARVDEAKLILITEKINEIAKFLYKNGRVVFLPEYKAADDGYIARANDT